jgi:hypothetical protein
MASLILALLRRFGLRIEGFFSWIRRTLGLAPVVKYNQVLLFGDSLFQQSVDLQDGFSFQAALQSRAFMTRSDHHTSFRELG